MGETPSPMTSNKADVVQLLAELVSGEHELDEGDRASVALAMTIARKSAFDGEGEGAFRGDRDAAALMRTLGTALNQAGSKQPPVVTVRVALELWRGFMSAKGAPWFAAMLLRDHPDEREQARNALAFAAARMLGELADPKAEGNRFDLARAVLADEAEKKSDELARLARDDRSALELAKAIAPHAGRMLGLLALDAHASRALDGSAPLWLDEALADYLDKLKGKAAKEGASLVRGKADERARAYKADSSQAVEWLKMWLPGSRAEHARAARMLARVVWLDEVGPRLLEEHRKASTPVRMATDLQRPLAQARAAGGRRDETSDGQILVEPPKGMTLILPFNPRLATQRSTGLFRVRDVLTDWDARIYLATLALYSDAGMRDDGSFELEGLGAILDLIGVAKPNHQGGRAYYTSKQRDAVRASLAKFQEIRVRAAGELVAASGDPLLDEIRDRRSGRVVTYAHSRLVVSAIRSANAHYAQIPREALRLPDAAFYAMGLAAISRARMNALWRKGAPIEAPIEGWLQAVGVDIAEGRRKHGRAFWEREADRLARVAEEGGFGRLTRAGEGEGMTLTLTPAEEYKAAYAPLVEAAKAAQRAEQAAKVADRRKRLPKGAGRKGEGV